MITRSNIAYVAAKASLGTASLVTGTATLVTSFACAKAAQTAGIYGAPIYDTCLHVAKSLNSWVNVQGPMSSIIKTADSIGYNSLSSFTKLALTAVGLGCATKALFKEATVDLPITLNPKKVVNGVGVFVAGSTATICSIAMISEIASKTGDYGNEIAQCLTTIGKWSSSVINLKSVTAEVISAASQICPSVSTESKLGCISLSLMVATYFLAKEVLKKESVLTPEQKQTELLDTYQRIMKENLKLLNLGEK